MDARTDEAGLSGQEPRRSLVAEMLRGYLHPHRVMLRQIAFGLAEPRALLHLLLGCMLLCVASIPAAIRGAPDLPVEDATSAAVSSRIFGYVIVMPILAYGFAALIRMVLGGEGLAVRSAVFWSLLLGGPIALVLSALSALEAVLPAGMSSVLGPVAFIAWLWILSASLGAASGRAPMRIFAILATAFVGLAVGLELAI